MRTQVEIIFDPNYLVHISRVVFKAPNLVHTSCFPGNLEGEKAL